MQIFLCWQKGRAETLHDKEEVRLYKSRILGISELATTTMIFRAQGSSDQVNHYFPTSINTHFTTCHSDMQGLVIERYLSTT